MSGRIRLLAVAVAAAIALPGVAAASADLEAQHRAIQVCKNLRFIGGEPRIVQRKDATAGSPMTIEIAPSDQVTIADADAINRCAASRLGVTEAEIEMIGKRQRTVVRSIRAPGGYYRRDCGRNPSILYKGDLYCQWARR